MYEHLRDAVKSPVVSASYGRRLLVGMLLAVLSSPAAADDPSGITSYAAAIVELTRPRWTGPRVPLPPFEARPEAERAGSALDAPIAVHGDGDVDAALRGALRMHEELRRLGYSPLPSDGRLGGGPELDLYLVRQDVAMDVGFDGFERRGLFDEGRVFVRLDASLQGARLEACAAEAFAMAHVATLDPAEAPVVRRAYALLYASPLYGPDACTDELAMADRRDSVDASSGRLARLLAALAARDADAPRRTLELARQRSFDDGPLRASPDLFEVLRNDAEARRRGSDALGVEEGVALAFPELRPPSPFDLLPRGADFDLALARLPARTAPFEPPLGVYGVARVDVDVAGAAERERLRVFLRGEAGTTFALSVLGIRADGSLATRVDAPVRREEPRAYVVLELAGLRKVGIVVTHLGVEPPDADTPDRHRRTFQLVVDRASDEP